MQSILNIIENDPLTPPERIAEMVSMPVEEVRAIIQRLHDEKIILGYKAIIDSDRAHRGLVRAVIEVRITPERDGGFDRIARRIARYDEVVSCFLMSGSYDLLVIVEGPELKALARFVSEKLSTIEGVLSTATHFMLKSYKERGTLFEASEDAERLKVTP